MRVVVTGGSGTVGAVTVAALTAAGHDVLIVDTREPGGSVPTGAEFVEASAADHSQLLAACGGADAIVHLAGIPKPVGNPPHLVHNTNVVASYNALSVAVELGITRIVMASSINAVGMAWSRDPDYDYFPLDEQHATRNEDPYSLSKWLGEVQADSVARMNPELTIASLRLHMFMPSRAEATGFSGGAYTAEARRGLWGYTTHRMFTDACLSALTADFAGHERFFLVADRNVIGESSRELASVHYPNVEVRPGLTGDDGFFDCTNARRLLGWSGHD